MSWAPRQPDLSASTPEDSPSPSPLSMVKKWLLALIVLIVLPIWGVETFIAWYYQRSPDADQTADYIQTFTYGEIQLAEAADRMELGDTTRWMLSVLAKEKALARSITLLEQFHEEYPEVAASEGADLYLSSLYLRAGKPDKAKELASSLENPYSGIILSLADNKPLDHNQVSLLEEHKDKYPHYSEAGFWYTRHLDLSGKSALDDSLNHVLDTDAADKKLLYRTISMGFCYVCLAVGFIYLLINIRNLEQLQPSAVEPGIIAGLFMFLLLEYMAAYTHHYLFQFCHHTLSISEPTSFIIADLVYRIAPAVMALIFLHFSRGKDSVSPLGTLKMTLPSVTICWGIGIFSYFLIHRCLSPHRLGDFITGLEGLVTETTQPDIFIYSILASVIIAPFTEEIIFRGLLLTALRRKLGTFIALFISSLLFALIHIQGFTDTIHIFLLGCILGITYLKTRTLWPGIIAHAGFNAWLYFETWNVYLAN